MNADQKNHNHHMESATTQEGKDNVEVQQPRMTVRQSILCNKK